MCGYLRIPEEVPEWGAALPSQSRAVFALRLEGSERAILDNQRIPSRPRERTEAPSESLRAERMMGRMTDGDAESEMPDPLDNVQNDELRQQLLWLRTNIDTIIDSRRLGALVRGFAHLRRFVRSE